MPGATAIAGSAAVVDTDVISFLFKGDSRAELYRPILNGRLLVISFMTVAELDRWAIQRKWGAVRRAQLLEHLKKFVVHPYDRLLCEKWAEATVSASDAGRPIQCADAWIAATALMHDIPLVTHNADDYAGVKGLKLLTA